MRLNSKYLNASVGAGNSTHSGAVSYYLFKDIYNLIVSLNFICSKFIKCSCLLFQIKIVTTIKSMNKGLVFFNNSWNVCRFAKLTNKIPLLNVYLRSAKKSAKFDIKCPFRKVIIH